VSQSSDQQSRSRDAHRFYLAAGYRTGPTGASST
jgi:hypothetical protein